jgi:SAM-dependent methyltransferase
MLAPDWSNGSYELIAPQLLPASRNAVAVADLSPGTRVVDIGCGSGNATLLAARPGVTVTGIDPAARLRDVAAAAAVAAGKEITFRSGTATATGLPDKCADVVLSVFGLIFEPDAAATARELDRIAAPDGRIVLTAWEPGGTLDEINTESMRTYAAAVGAPARPAGGDGTRWHDPASVGELLAPYGFRVTAQRHTNAFTADSPEAYWELSAQHPFAVSTWDLLAGHGLLDGLRSRTLAILDRVNEEPGRLRFTAPYQVLVARRG